MVNNRQYSYKEIKATDESGMSYWVYITRPFVYKLTSFFANYTMFTPNHITTLSLIFGLLSAYLFLKGTQYYYIIGALFFEFSFMLDYCDGRIARLKGLKSTFGAYFDAISDFTKYFFITLGIAYGQFIITKDVSFLLFGYLFGFTQMMFTANNYIIRFNQPEFGLDRDSIYQMRYNELSGRLPYIMKLKKKLDPDDKLTFIPNDSETIAFFIAPIIMEIKLGFIFGSIILLFNILCLAIYNFLIKKR